MSQLGIICALLPGWLAIQIGVALVAGPLLRSARHLHSRPVDH